MINKRGIAPLVATLLLLSFAVALGVVIMSFGRAQVELEAKCPINVGLKLSKEGTPLCYDANSKELKFNVENGVNINVEGLVVNVIGSQQAQSFELNDAMISKAGLYSGKINYDSDSGGVLRQIKITPKINLHDNEQVCTDKAVIIEEIKDC
jgi:hypothetical protein